jgi:hypothetical protein
VDPLRLELQAFSELEIEGAEGLVEEQHVRLVDERPRERHPLLLAAGELVGPAALVARQVDLLEDGRRPALDIGAATPRRFSPNAMLPATSRWGNRA